MMSTEDPRHFDPESAIMAKHEVFTLAHSYCVPFQLKTGYSIAEGPLPFSILFLTPSRLYLYQNDSLRPSELYRFPQKTLLHPLQALSC